MTRNLNILLAFALLPLNTLANNEASLPIEVTADRLESQTKQSISIYQGKVIITQGKTILKGDKVTLKHPDGKMQHAVVVGAPASFKRFLEDENKWLTGHANQITYNLDQQHLELLGEAKVQQGSENAITGPKITYHLEDKTLTAEKTPQQNKRVKVIFQPESQ